MISVQCKARAPEARIPELDDLREIETMLRESVLEWTREWVEQGEKRGREEGRKQGEATLLRQLLERKFGGLTPGHAERLDSASEADLMTWADRLLTAGSVEEVLGEE